MLYVFTGSPELNVIRLNLIFVNQRPVCRCALLRSVIRRVQLSSPRDLANSKYKDSALIGSRGTLGSPPIKE